MMLEIKGLEAGYRGSLVLHGVDLAVAEGAVVALLGRNGMGKTTLLKTLMGLVPAAAGRIGFCGADIAGRAPYAVARLGIAYVPQGRDVFPDLSVVDNLRLGRLGKPGLDDCVPDHLFGYFPILAERRAQKAGTLSGGEQQQLAIARALAGVPRLLLLDEPSEGIQPSIVAELGRTLRAIAEAEALTILIVEQNVELVFDLADDCAFIENGRVAERVATAQLQADDTLLHRYLAV